MKKKDLQTVGIGLILIIVFFTFVSMPLWGVDKDGAIRILNQENYTNIKIQGYSWFGCSDSDFFRTKFTAKKNDKIVKGAVCKTFVGNTIKTF